MLLALLLICVALFVVLPLIGAALNVLWALVLGFLLGLVARAIAIAIAMPSRRAA